MLTRKDNERLVRIGPGQPAGELMRRYWQPALLSSELPARDGAPIRVRLLGEDLVAFRDTNNKVGLVDAYCPHRRAPLFFGRNEDCGLRCVYHGWKFDVNGACIDLPSEPESSRMKDRVRLKAYPTFESGGVVWAYLGPADKMPEPPDFEWQRAPDTHRFVTKTFEACNYLQALEGGLDTAHSSFLHNNYFGNKKALRNRDGAPRLDIEVTDYGYSYASTRDLKEDGEYIRVYHFVMPNQQMRGMITGLLGGREKVPKLDGHLWVPIDDEHTWVYNWAIGYDQSVPLTHEFMRGWEHIAGRGEEDLVSGTFRLKRDLSNDYFIDRTIQKTQTFTGIDGVNTQDFAVQEGMGSIVDRSKESLGSSDKAILALRRLLLEATEAVERSDKPRGVDPATHRHIRPYDDIVPLGVNWKEALAGELKAKW